MDMAPSWCRRTLPLIHSCCATLVLGNLKEPADTVQLTSKWRAHTHAHARTHTHTHAHARTRTDARVVKAKARQRSLAMCAAWWEGEQSQSQSHPVLLPAMSRHPYYVHVEAAVARLHQHRSIARLRDRPRPLRETPHEELVHRRVAVQGETSGVVEHQTTDSPSSRYLRHPHQGTPFNTLIWGSMTQ